MVKELFKNLLLFCIFGAIYCGIEILWRGYTNISMGVVGGIAGVFIGQLNERIYNRYADKISILAQCIIGCVWITLLEGCFGYILNVVLKLNIWDYSGMPGQFFFGQCCVPYCILWFFLAGAAVFLDDWIRYLLFDEPIKKYKWI